MAFAPLQYEMGVGGIAVVPGAPPTVYFCMTGPAERWVGMRYDAAVGGYQQVYFSEPYPSRIRGIAYGELDGLPGGEIALVLASGDVVIHDEATRELKSIFPVTLHLPPSSDIGFCLYDVDGDQVDDVLLSSVVGMQVYSATGVLTGDYPGVTGTDVVAGQMDGDPGIEAATTDGSVVDLATASVQWSWFAGFGIDLDLSDFDGDGMQELVCIEDWYNAWAFDVDLCLPKWNIPFSPPTPDLAALAMADLDGDGVEEVLVGYDQGSYIHTFDAVTLAPRGQVLNGGRGTNGLVAADFDGDGLVELLHGSGAYISGRDSVRVSEWWTGALEWESVPYNGPFLGPERGDLDGDGIEELVIVAPDTGTSAEDGHILVFDGELRLLADSGPMGVNIGLSSTRALRLHDVDGDGADEVLAASSNPAYAGKALVEIWKWMPAGDFQRVWVNFDQPDGADFASVEVADVDGDGNLEILAGAAPYSTAALGVYLYVYDYLSTLEEWRTIPMGASQWDAITAIEVQELDGDPGQEIVALVEDGPVYVYDGATRSLEAVLQGNYSAARAYSAQGSLPPMIALGTSAGAVEAWIWQPGGYVLLGGWPAAPDPVDGFAIAAGRLFLGSGGRIYAHQLPPAAAPLGFTVDRGEGTGERSLLLPGGRLLTTGADQLLVFPE